MRLGPFALILGVICYQFASPALPAQSRAGLTPPDLLKIRSVSEVQISPRGTRVAYSVTRSDDPRRARSEVWVIELATRQQARLGDEGMFASTPRWSPDGDRIAFLGRRGDDSGLFIARLDGSPARFIADVSDTNHPLPSSGEEIAWSPDGQEIAFVSSRPGPEADANGDPMVITRYLYKPTASEGRTRFNDNRRLHLFVANAKTRAVEQLTDGPYYEHSIAWSPDGSELAFISNRAADPDRVFNYDIFAVNVRSRATRRLTSTPNAEYRPAWSPDGRRLAYLGTTRPLTSSETTMEDTHVWVMDRDGGDRRDIGAKIDNRQGPPRWAADGRSVYATVQERGSVHLYRFPLTDAGPEPIVRDEGSLGAWSASRDGTLAFALATPSAPAELIVERRGERQKLTRVNADWLGGRALAAVERLTFNSADGTPIEAFLTRPLGLTPSSRHPLIVMIHGGPHAQQGPAFNAKAQVYAARGWASLMVNYRGSTGYGQKLADAIFGDQNGGEARDVTAGVDAALQQYPWIDRDRLGIEGGSYGGQLTNWIITQTDRFRAAIPSAGISNLVSFNYMAYYHDYLAVEFGRYPHEDGLMDLLWQRSPLRLVAKVRTPTLILHGENDNDVPIAEAEQFYIALRDVGVPAVLVRYPREGHGLREPGHIVDALERSIAWYEKHFAAGSSFEVRGSEFGF